MNNSMQQNTLEADSARASQEIHPILWYSMFYYTLHTSPLPVPILNHINLVHIHLVPLNLPTFAYANASRKENTPRYLFYIFRQQGNLLYF
jgi:hypothetical protein